MQRDGAHRGFSIDLMNSVTEELGWQVTYHTADSFGSMLEAVETGAVDAAIANISVTAEHERRMDFSQPIFDSAIQVLTPSGTDGGPSLIAALFTRDIGIAVASALAPLFGGGMLMSLFERKSQPYFDRPLKDASFPTSW